MYLAARDEAKATEALARLELDGLGPGNGQVLWHEFDLSDPRKAKKPAEEFLKKETRLDVLSACIHLMSKTLADHSLSSVNNAAVLIAPYAKSVDGIY